MKINNETQQEQYFAPACKVVNVTMKRNVMAASQFGVDDLEKGSDDVWA